MSYFVAPDTGKRYDIFGHGGAANAAARHGHAVPRRSAARHGDPRNVRCRHGRWSPPIPTARRRPAFRAIAREILRPQLRTCAARRDSCRIALLCNRLHQPAGLSRRHERLQLREGDMFSVDRGQFGPNFVFGAATAAYQIEGGQIDGRGPCIWDTFRGDARAM